MDNTPYTIAVAAMAEKVVKESIVRKKKSKLETLILCGFVLICIVIVVIAVLYL